MFYYGYSLTMINIMLRWVALGEKCQNKENAVRMCGLV